ncbi:protein mono-ADP-ribosyltransferase PARP12-like [Procambarus clarkii]|uniref:protein mono-ADP-ribosyltransferase PARP12-like n=1 Tax=Procambarus clarkii TaxID=6728 RepID=UPI003742D172
MGNQSATTSGRKTASSSSSSSHVNHRNQPRTSSAVVTDITSNVTAYQPQQHSRTISSNVTATSLRIKTGVPDKTQKTISALPNITAYQPQHHSRTTLPNVTSTSLRVKTGIPDKAQQTINHRTRSTIVTDLSPNVTAYQPQHHSRTTLSNVTSTSLRVKTGVPDKAQQTVECNINVTVYQPQQPRTISPNVSAILSNVHVHQPQEHSKITSFGVIATSLRKKTKVPDKAQQTIKYNINNYIIPKLHQSQRQQQQQINLPSQIPPALFALRVCPQYNCKNGCNALICRRLHVCHYWIMKDCKKVNCENAHSLTSDHNSKILNVFSDFDLNAIIETIQNNYKRMRKLNQEQDDYICIHGIMNKCNRNPCSQVHGKKTYQWEVRDFTGKWIQFSYTQSDYLEGLFWHPSQATAELPPLPSHMKNHKTLQQLQYLLAKGKSQWKVDMETMSLYTDMFHYNIRRVSTPSDITTNLHLASRWIWYWQDNNESWQPYTDGVQKYFIVALSDQLEYHMHFNDGPFRVKVGSHNYVIDTQNMTQQNKETGKVQQIRRRPACMVLENKVTFDRMFSTLHSEKEFMLHHVLPSTSEFTLIENMIKESLPSVRLSSITKVQNNHLWKAYQNRKHQLLAFYSNDLSLLNEQYLFHGIKHSVIDEICCNNFDWRLFGSNTSNVYGQGEHFSNKVSILNTVCQTNNSGLKALFVVYVLVGTMTIGNPNMEFPPENPETGRCFDTTCNDKHSSDIFVKYNRNEYYPAYIVKYHANSC